MTKPLATALSEVRSRDAKIAKLQAENAKLRKCVEYYARTIGGSTKPAQACLDKLKGGGV